MLSGAARILPFLNTVWPFITGQCTFSSLGADNCFIINGRLTLLLNPIDNDSYNSTASAEAAMDVTQSNIKKSMDDDDLLSHNMPEVIRVHYLGDDYAQYLARSAGGDLSKDVVVSPLLVDSVSGSEHKGDGAGWGLLWGLLGVVLLACCAILFSILFLRRRAVPDGGSRKAKGREPDSQAVGEGFDWEDWDESLYNGEGAGRHGGDAGTGESANDEVVLHVGNVGPNTTADNIRDLFEQHATVNNCIVPQDHQERVGGDMVERFALLTMPRTTNDSDRARAKVHGQVVDGYVLEVQEVTTLYVGNIGPDTSEGDVRSLFERRGNVTGCIVPPDHEEASAKEGKAAKSPRRRFALVTMPTDEAADVTRAVHGLEVGGRTLSVRDMRRMNSGRRIAGGGLAAAALAAGSPGAVRAFTHGFNRRGRDEVKLRVGNLGPGTTEAEVREIFEGYGEVRECVVIPSLRDEEGGGGGGGGFAIITMPAHEAESAFNHANRRGVEVNGRQLSVQEESAGLGGRNLIDDMSSAYDNSYEDSRCSPSKQGDVESTLGKKAGLGAMGTFLAIPFLLKAFRKKKKPQEDENASLTHLGSITGRSYGNSPETEQSLNDGLDNIISTIDGATATEDRRNFVVDPVSPFHEAPARVVCS